MEIVFTNAEKLRIFLRAIISIQYDIDIDRIKTHPDSLVGLCWHLTKASEKLGLTEKGCDVGYNMYKYFPEVYKMKPRKAVRYSNSYWFPVDLEGMKKRIKVLEKVIKKLEKLENL